MKPKMLLLVAIFSGILVGGIGVWFLKDPLTTVMISADAKTAASHIKVVVVDNGYQFNMNPDAGKSKILYWQSGGAALAIGETWIECAWQLNLGGEDKPKDGQGDFMDIILKITRWKDGKTTYTVVCGGEYAKKVYYDTTLKLDMSGTGDRYTTWNV